MYLFLQSFYTAYLFNWQNMKDRYPISHILDMNHIIPFVNLRTIFGYTTNTDIFLTEICLISRTSDRLGQIFFWNWPHLYAPSWFEGAFNPSRALTRAAGHLRRPRGICSNVQSPLNMPVGTYPPVGEMRLFPNVQPCDKSEFGHTVTQHWRKLHTPS